MYQILEMGDGRAEERGLAGVQAWLWGVNLRMTYVAFRLREIFGIRYSGFGARDEKMVGWHLRFRSLHSGGYG